MVHISAAATWRVLPLVVCGVILFAAAGHFSARYVGIGAADLYTQLRKLRADNNVLMYAFFLISVLYVVPDKAHTQRKAADRCLCVLQVPGGAKFD